MKILVIDDEPLVRRAISRAARSRGHEVSEAENGLEGLQTWKSSVPDIVYLDVLMPKMSGPEVLADLESAQKSAKVILMSAYSGEFDIIKAKGIGASLFIQKPFANIFDVIDAGEGLFHGS